MPNRSRRLTRQHSDRFRWIDDIFPSLVAEAYGGDIVAEAQRPLRPYEPTRLGMATRRKTGSALGK
jgi:hypothetical protein